MLAAAKTFKKDSNNNNDNNNNNNNNNNDNNNNNNIPIKPKTIISTVNKTKFIQHIQCSFF